MVCIRWMDALLQDHMNVIGVYNVGTIDAKTLTDALEEVLLRAGLEIHNCRSTMMVLQIGLDLNLVSNHTFCNALLTHCYGHSLNLAVGDALKVCSDALIGFGF